MTQEEIERERDKVPRARGAACIRVSPTKVVFIPQVDDRYPLYTDEIKIYYDPNDTVANKKLSAIIEERKNDGSHFTKDEHGRFTGSTAYASGGGRIKLKPNINKFPDNEAIKKYAENVPNKKGYFDVALHGTSDFVQYDGRNISAREMANIIKHDKNYKDEKVRLLSCSTGKLKNGTCFAQNLANALGVEVEAPSNDLWIYSNGRIRVAGNGKMELFKPNKE